MSGEISSARQFIHPSVPSDPDGLLSASAGGWPLDHEGMLEGCDGLFEGSEGLSEKSEGSLEGSEGLLEGSEG